MDSERDPRIDPMPGDVLKKGSKVREVRYLYGSKGNRVSYLWCGEARAKDYPHHPDFECVMPFLPQWRKWAVGADVIRRGDD